MGVNIKIEVVVTRVEMVVEWWQWNNSGG